MTADVRIACHAIGNILESHKGREKGIHLAELHRQLRRMTGMIISEREMRQLIAERFAHVCSGPSGLFLARDREEAREAVAYHKAYIANHQRRATAIERQRFPGEDEQRQLSLGI